MPRYSDERRQAAVAKLLPPYNQSVEEVARQEVSRQPLFTSGAKKLVLRDAACPMQVTRVRPAGRPETSLQRWLRPQR
jgi:hypothetical protein